MKNGHPVYFHYLPAWVLTWLMILLLAHIPMAGDILYDSLDRIFDVIGSTVLLLSLGTLLGFFFGSLSWILQWGTLGLLQRLRVTAWFPEKPKGILRISMIAASILSMLELVIFGCPLGGLTWNMYQHPWLPLDGGEPSISPISIIVRVAGLAASFPIACLASAYVTGSDPRRYLSNRRALSSKPKTDVAGRKTEN